jgi:hypothetical protein
MNIKFISLVKQDFCNIVTRPCLKIEKNINITNERHFLSVRDQYERIWI